MPIYSASVGKIVAILALLPPWILLYLVSGSKGMWSAWPLAIVGSLGYIAGQLPTAVYLGPYLPDVIGSIVCFAVAAAPAQGMAAGAGAGLWRCARDRRHAGGGARPNCRRRRHGLAADRDPDRGRRRLDRTLVASAFDRCAASRRHRHLGDHAGGRPISAIFNWTPFVGGTAILVSWIITVIVLRVSLAQIGAIFAKTWSQMWGACLVGVFIFGLAYVFNYSGMAGSLASAFSKLGVAFIIVAPILGFIGVALSGSNTSTNAMFGAFQALVGKVLGFPLLLLPTLNSVGAEIGKPIAPQTASVGVSTSRFVRNEGEVIRHNFGWTLVLLVYLVIIGVACYLFFPNIAALPH